MAHGMREKTELIEKLFKDDHKSNYWGCNYGELYTAIK